MSFRTHVSSIGLYRCSECSGSISQLPFQSWTESAQICDTITVPHSSPCGVSTVSSCLYLDKRDSIGNSEPTNSRANPSPPQGPDLVWGKQKLPVSRLDQHSGEWRGFQDAIYMIQKPPLLFPSFSFRYSLCIIFQDFQGFFLSSRPFKSWGQGKLFGIVHGDVHQWHTIWVPPKHSVVPETWLTQEDHMAMVALLHWNCNKSLQNLLLLP